MQLTSTQSTLLSGAEAIVIDLIVIFYMPPVDFWIVSLVFIGLLFMNALVLLNIYQDMKWSNIRIKEEKNEKTNKEDTQEVQ